MVRGIGTDLSFWDLRTKIVGERRSAVGRGYLVRLVDEFDAADEVRRRKDKNDGNSFDGSTAVISGALRLLPHSRREPFVSGQI